MLEKRKVSIYGGTIIDGLGGKKENMTVLIKEGKVEDLVDGKVCPEGYDYFSAEGKYIMPGMIEMHGHFYGRSSKPMRSQHKGYCPLYLAGGITTVRTPGEFEPDITIKWKNDIEKFKAIGPRIVSAGSYFDRNPSVVSWIEGSNSIDEIKDKYIHWKDKIDFVKVYSNMPGEWIKVLSELAHADGYKVYGHLGMSTATDSILAGINGLEHGIFTMTEFRHLNVKVDEDLLFDFDPFGEQATNLIKLIVDKDIALIPTTITFNINSLKFKENIKKYNLWQYLSDEGKENHRSIIDKTNKNNSADDKKKGQALIDKQYAFINRAYQAGARIFCGTDPSYPLLTPGYAIVWEAEHMSLSGINNEDIIKSLTSEAARELNLFNEIGSIEVGKAADIVILDKNPIKHISNLSSVTSVFKSGILFDPKELRKSAIGSLQ